MNTIRIGSSLSYGEGEWHYIIIYFDIIREAKEGLHDSLISIEEKMKEGLGKRPQI